MQSQQRELDARLDYLIAAARRTPRIDWWNLVAGSLVTLVLTSVLPGQAVQSILTMAARGLWSLFGEAPASLPPDGAW